MKLEDMILVTENYRGTERKFLAGLAEYMGMMLDACGDSAQDMADAVQQLYATREDEKRYNTLYFSADKSSRAAFCSSVGQLVSFLAGEPEDREGKAGAVFDESMCTPGCLEVLKAYGLGTDGRPLSCSFHYEQTGHVFHAGESIKNLYGGKYHILEVLDPKNLLLMSENTGEILVGVDTEYFKRTPSGTYASPDSEVRGIEWRHGIYLGKSVSAIDFEGIRSRYGIQEETEKLQADDTRKMPERHGR